MNKTGKKGIQEQAWLCGKSESLGIVQKIKVWPF